MGAYVETANQGQPWNPPGGEFDQDCDVDQDDFGHLQECYTGPAPNPLFALYQDEWCRDADILGADSQAGQDQRVTSDEVAWFVVQALGPNICTGAGCQQRGGHWGLDQDFDAFPIARTTA